MDVNSASLFAILLGASGVIGIVAVVAFLFFELRKGRDKAEKETRNATDPATPTQPKPAGSPPALGGLFKRTAPPPPANTHEVLRISRDNLTGRLIVELAGQRFNRFEEIQNPDLTQALLTTLRDLREFTGEPPAAPASTSTAAPAPASAPASNPPSMPAPSAPIMPPVLSSAKPAEPAPMPKPSMNPFKQARVLREMAKNPPPTLKTIPEIIDEYLQQKLLGTPHIWRGIRVKLGPKDSVLFEVDGHSYTSVEAVPDAEVQTLIRSAIAEWDAKK